MVWKKLKNKKSNIIEYKKKGVTWYYDKRRGITRNFNTRI